MQQLKERLEKDLLEVCFLNYIETNNVFLGKAWSLPYFQNWKKYEKEKEEKKKEVIEKREEKTTEESSDIALLLFLMLRAQFWAWSQTQLKSR